MPRTKKAVTTKTKSSRSKTSKAKASKAPSRKASPAKAKAKKITKAKTASKKSKITNAKSSEEESLELLNETGRRRENIKPPVERRKRRRQIDPTTCERDYNEQEIEFMQAMDDYKRQSGRMFPTCSEILEVLIKLGYRQVAESSDVMFDPNEDSKKAVAEESLDTEYEGEEDDE